MIKIETLEVAGLASAFQALRLPFGKECRSYCDWSENLIQFSDSDKELYFDSLSLHEIDDRDLILMSTLVKRGDEHSKIVRGIIVYAQIEAPIWFYRELETYKIGRERLACESTMHIDCKGLNGDELEKAKNEIPMGKTQKTIDWFSYQTLRRIWIQRHKHRLPMWHDFCKWIEALPFFNTLIMPDYEKYE